MAEESDSGPNRRRARTRPMEADAIERRNRDPAGLLGATNDRSDVTADAAVREDGNNAAPLPPRVARKYYITPTTHGTDERRAYADERGEYLVFKDEGHRLSTRRHETAVVRDLVAIARHRDWTALHVTGSAAFRREIWFEAQGRGIDVTGYAPSPLDREVLARQDARRSKDGRNDPARRPSSQHGAERTGAAAANDGREPTRSSENGTPDRLAHSPSLGADRPPDDAFQRRRRGHAEADGQLRSLPAAPTVADPSLAAAHSQIAVLDRAVRRAFPDDSTMRDTVLRAARERVAFHLAEGRALHRASYRMPTGEKAWKTERSGDMDKAQPGDRIERFRNIKER